MRICTSHKRPTNLSCTANYSVRSFSPTRFSVYLFRHKRILFGCFSADVTNTRIFLMTSNIQIRRGKAGIRTPIVRLTAASPNRWTTNPKRFCLQKGAITLPGLTTVQFKVLTGMAANCKGLTRQ